MLNPETEIWEVEEPLWSTKQVRDYLGINDYKLDMLRKNGILRYVNLPGSRKRYFRREVQKYGKTLKARRNEAKD